MSFEKNGYSTQMDNHVEKVILARMIKEPTQNIHDSLPFTIRKTVAKTLGTKAITMPSIIVTANESAFDVLSLCLYPTTNR